jgi:signal transduction histidine kinase
VLTDRGLAPALEMPAGRASIPIELHTALSGGLPGAVEAAAYYLVAGALTNPTKPAGATRVRVDVCREDADAGVEVADDGAGGADEPAGSGLRGQST